MKKILTLFVLILLGAMTKTSAEDFRGEGLRKIWEYRLDGNMTTTTFTESPTYDQSLGFDLTLAYNFNSIFSTGFSTGLMHDFGRTPKYRRGEAIPLLGDVQVRWNFYYVTLFLEGRAGLLWGDITTSNRTDARYASYRMWEAQPGIMIRVNPKIDIRLSVGYARAQDIIHKKYDENYLIFKLGFARRFRKIIL